MGWEGIKSSDMKAISEHFCQIGCWTSERQREKKVETLRVEQQIMVKVVCMFSFNVKYYTAPQQAEGFLRILWIYSTFKDSCSKTASTVEARSK